MSEGVIVAVAALVTYLVFTNPGEAVEGGAVRRAVKCQKPKIDNGIIAHEDVKEEYNVGEYVKIMCNSTETHYRLIGSDRLKCSDDGQWSDNPPYCEVVTCPRPVQIMNGFIELEEPANIQSVARFSCSLGFTLIGRSELVCGQDGKWIPDSMPRCEANRAEADAMATGVILSGSALLSQAWKDIRCPGLPYIKGLKSNEQSAIDGSEQTKFFCDEGILVGDPVLYCAKNGSWVPNVVPFCEFDEVTCRGPVKIMNGSIELEEPENNGSWGASFSCDPGFTLIGPSKLKCGPNGTWTPDKMPRCEEVTCRGPVKIMNGSIELEEPENNGSWGASFSCDPGFTLIGPSKLKCGPNGTWTPDKMPRCEDTTNKATSDVITIRILSAVLGVVVFVSLVVVAIVAYTFKTRRCCFKERDESASRNEFTLSSLNITVRDDAIIEDEHRDLMPPKEGI